MVSISWTFVCLIIVDLLWQRVTGSGEGLHAMYGYKTKLSIYHQRFDFVDERVTGFLTWNGTLPRRHSSGSGGGNSTGFCMDWSKNFSTPHDVLLRLNAKLDHNLSLQIFKYTDTTASELVGELKGCGDPQQYVIALANCTRFVLKFVANPCLQTVRISNLFYYAVHSLPDLNSGFCHHSPCTTNIPCLHLQLPDSMGYRCYCKNWLPGNCTPGLMNSSDPSSCKCPGVNYVGEICNLIAPATTIATTGGQTQSVSPNPSGIAVASNQSSSGSSSSTFAVAIGAGVGGGVVVILLLLVLFIILYCRSHSKQSEISRRSPEEEILPRSQYSWNSQYKTASRNPTDEQHLSPCNNNNKSNQNGTSNNSDADYSYPFVPGGTSKTLDNTPNTYEPPAPVIMSNRDEPYWQPEQTIEKLYAQFEGKRFRMLQRSDVQVETDIGSGEFGTVARGSLKSASGLEVVAVKTLNSGSSSQDQIRFLREAAIMGQFKHKNVVALKGVILQGEPLMIVLEYMVNGDLRQHLQSVREDGQCHVDGYANTLLRMSREIASGMVYLSRKGFIHRDLAVRNVLLDSSLTCKIGDFGLARDLPDNDYYMTRGGRLPIRWTAPEAITRHKYSSASDVWGYGIVLYETWSVGERPYGSTWTNKFVIECLEKGYRLPPPPGCPLPMYQLMIICWHPDHHARPTFTTVVDILGKNDDQLLVNGPGAEPVRGRLGDPVDSVLELYMNVQTTYQTKNTE